MCARADYFASHMGDYEGVLASLETLNLSILKAMDFTKKVCVCVLVVTHCGTNYLQGFSVSVSEI